MNTTQEKIAAIENLLSNSVLRQITDKRICEPELPLQLARQRRKRQSLTTDGKLNLIAADHPARRVLKAGEERMGMADRHDMLLRVTRILAADAADGVMATMDVLEDLLVLEHLLVNQGAASFLAEKVILVSLNRGGLSGAIWELDDAVTGPCPSICADWGFDGIKLLLRICDGDADSLKTMLYCREAINQANALGLRTFLEPMPVRKGDDEIKLVRDAEQIAKTVAVASALGDSSRYLWLKLPFCPHFEIVAKSTTLPILLLGGETEDARVFLEEVKAGLRCGYNVRGAMIGRNLLHPRKHGDSVEISLAVHELIHSFNYS